MKMTLYKMGNDFAPSEYKDSDVGNYRVRTSFADKAGIDVSVDFGSWAVVETLNGHFKCFEYKKCKNRVSHPNALHLDAAYKDPEGTWRDYVYTYMNNNYDYTLKYDYTIAGIKAFLSDITGQTVDELEFAEYTRGGGDK